MKDMVLDGMTYDSLAAKYFVSRTMVVKYRKRAIVELDRLYTVHDAEVAAYILN